jgi:hypothetical protein
MNDATFARAVQLIHQHLQILHVEISRNSSYLARQEIERLKARLQDQPQRLELHGFKVYSQNDEDGILEEIFRRLSVEKGTFCEIGVENGLECNSLYLLHKGWRGAWLEGNPGQKIAIETKFKQLLDKRRLAFEICHVLPESLNGAITRALAALDLAPQQLDFLSIDIDGMDIYLLEALDLRPKSLCIEYNAKFPPPLHKRPVFDPGYAWKVGTDYMGASLAALVESAHGLGYELVGTNVTGSNAFFVRKDLLNEKFTGPFTAEALYNPPRYYLTEDHYVRSCGHAADFGPYVDLV